MALLRCRGVNRTACRQGKSDGDYASQESGPVSN
jgi:hypothetical protein